MSKPNKPGELQNVEVDAISIVSKAANKKRFKIFKSEEPEQKNEEIEKSGRKISSSRLEKLKNIQATLNDLLSGLEEDKEESKLNTEEITKAVQDAIKPLDERIAKLETVTKDEEAAPEAAKSEQPVQPEQPKASDVAEVVKSAVAEALAPLTARVEKIENARGFSNRVPEETHVEKSSNLWAGIF